MLLGTNQINAQCFLLCENSINVSLDENCLAVISADEVFDGVPPSSCSYTVTIEETGSDSITAAGAYTYELANDFGNSCWGIVIANDKLPPSLTCQCDTLFSPVQQFAGALNANSSRWTRPENSSGSCEGASNVTFEVFEFQIESFTGGDELIVFTSSAENSFMSLYQSGFDPSEPCSNIVAVDNDGGVNDVSQLTTNLSPGVNYFLVISPKTSASNNLGAFSIFVDQVNAQLMQVNPICEFFCHELNEQSLLDDILPSVNQSLPVDNCNSYDFLPESINISMGDDCGSRIVERILSYGYNNGTEYETVSCTQNFLFKAVTLTGGGATSNGVWEEFPGRGTHGYYFPQEEVIMTCGSSLEVVDIVDYFDIDTPGRPVGKENDDFGVTSNVIENNEGIPYAYPYYVALGQDGNYHAQIIDGNVCNLFFEYSDNVLSACGSACPGNVRAVRSWFIIDWCTGATEVFDQFIRAVDEEAPNIEVNDLTVSVDPWECNANFEVPIPEVVHDNCDNSVQFNVTPPTGINIENNTANEVPIGEHIFVYDATDCCGNMGTAEMKVTVVDQTPPIAQTKENIVVNLTTDGLSEGIAKIFPMDIDNNSSDGCGALHMEIRREDPTSENCAPGNSTYSNNINYPNNDENDPDNGEFVTFCCDDLTETDLDGTPFGEYTVWLRVWDDGDFDGVFGSAGDNFNESWTTVRVEDKLDANIICPDNIELECLDAWEDPLIAGAPSASTGCGIADCDEMPTDNFVDKPAGIPPFQGEAIPAYDPTCRRGAIRRNWTCAGQQCTQWIIMRDGPADQIEITWPEDLEIDCDNFDQGEPVYQSGPCGMIGTTLDQDTFFFEENTCFKLINEWTVINWCEYDEDDSDLNDFPELSDDGITPGYFTHTQTVLYFDNEPPELVLPDTTYSLNLKCETENQFLEASAIDDGACASLKVSWLVDIDLWQDGVIDYSYSSFLPVDDEFYLAPSEENISVPIPDGLTGGCESLHAVLWTVRDACGNNRSRSSIFTIVDDKAPGILCANITTATMTNGSVEIDAKTFDHGTWDNCFEDEGNQYTFSDIPPPTSDDGSIVYYNEFGTANLETYLAGEADAWNPETNSATRIITCDIFADDNHTGGYSPINMYVWDQCLNKTMCIINIRLIDEDGEGCVPLEIANFQGRVVNINQEPVSDITIEVENISQNYTFSETTDENGFYTLTQNPLTNDYRISGYGDQDHKNGVSAADLIAIQRHVLGIESITSPYSLIGADANCDERISAIDIIQIQRLILGVNQEFEYCPSWVLIPENVELSEDPWPFESSIEIVDLLMDELDVNFIAQKVGDVNASASPNIHPLHMEERSENICHFSYSHALQGDISEIEFSTDQGLYGFQLSLNIGPAELINFDSDLIEINESNYHFEDGVLKIVWTSPTKIDTDGPLFSVRFESLTKEITLDKSMVSLAVDNVRSAGQEIILNAGKTIDYQVFPNPWDDKLNVGIQSAKEDKIEFRFFTADGRLIFNDASQCINGYNQFTFDRQRFDGMRGLVFMEIQLGERRIIDKIIL